VSKVLKVDDELQELIPPLTAEEYRQLEENIVAEGCRDAIVVWSRLIDRTVGFCKGANCYEEVELIFGDEIWKCAKCGYGVLPFENEEVIVDGHNRYKICVQHGIEFDTVEKEFDDIDHAKDWIDMNQLGRRNLTPDQMRLLRGRRYNRAEKRPGARTDLTSDQNDTRLPVADKLAKEHGVSAPTIKRDGKFYEEVEKLKEKYPEEIKSIFSGAERASKVIKNIKANERNEAMESKPLPDNKYHIIYCDPPWQYSNSGFAMSAENQYPTIPTEKLKKMDVQSLANEDAVMFMWATNPLLKDAMELMDSWGFNYKTNMVWTKDRHTAGFYVFGQHELLLIGVKGSLLPSGSKPKSIITGANNVHSKKPDIVYSLINAMYPGLKCVELFARNTHPGWESWGNQV
jgi:N6-adenosine-specific RNA methylase IME4